MNFKSNILEISNRALIILGSLAGIWYLLFLVYIGYGIQSGYLYAQTIQPIKENLNALAESMMESDSAVIPDPYDVSLDVEINNTVKTSTPEGELQQIQQTEYSYPQPTVVYYTYPTAKPGQPGSSEWEEQFWKEWNERGAYIDQKNAEVQQSQEEFMKNFEQQKLEGEAFKQQVEESQKKFCEENPDLCN